ncbi:MAG: DUF2892 domain-containing protein [Halobacteriales archaeon]
MRIGVGAALIGGAVATGPLHPVKSTLAIGAGGTMLATGATGHCPATEVADVDTTEE